MWYKQIMRLGYIWLVIVLVSPVWGERPRVAILPLSGGATAELKEKVSFSLRAKLDREGTYQAVSGIEAAEAWGDDPPPTVQSEPTGFLVRFKALAPSIFIYGQLDGTIRDGTLTLAVWDARGGDAPKLVGKHLSAPTDLRFVSEEILTTLARIKPFEHPSEEAVQQDAVAEMMWETHPNLAPNGGFDQASDWEGIYQLERYTVSIQPQPPGPDQVCIWKMPQGEQVLAMNLSRTAAENNGLACLSSAIPIEPQTRYRLQFRYRSDGPKLHVFVKGYTRTRNVRGELVEREIYRRQVPPTGATDGQWVVMTDELNPQHQALAVQTLRIDLYAYLHPGQVLFDDIVLKAVGAPTRHATDDAMDQPVTRPATRP